MLDIPVSLLSISGVSIVFTSDCPAADSSSEQLTDNQGAMMKAKSLLPPQLNFMNLKTAFDTEKADSSGCYFNRERAFATEESD